MTQIIQRLLAATCCLFLGACATGGGSGSTTEAGGSSTTALANKSSAATSSAANDCADYPIPPPASAKELSCFSSGSSGGRTQDYVTSESLDTIVEFYKKNNCCGWKPKPEDEGIHTPTHAVVPLIKEPGYATVSVNVVDGVTRVQINCYPHGNL